MNWMGGARNRVKYRGEKKIQKEFFDKRRLAGVALSARTSMQKKHGISEDLMALHTVSRIRSQPHIVNNVTQRPIKFVDLEKFHSCTRSVEEVDMGPCSPGMPMSKIFTKDRSMHDRKTNPIFTTTSNMKGKPSKKPAQDAFLQPMVIPKGNDRQGDVSLCETERIWYKKREALPSVSSPLERTSTFKNGVDAASSDLFKLTQSKHSEKQTGCHHVEEKSLKFDPFASEDFQMTPLVKYGKNDSKSTALARDKLHGHSHGNKHMVYASEKDSKNVVHKHAKHVSGNRSYYTSTPLKFKDGLDHQSKLYPFITENVSESVSPIQKIKLHHTHSIDKVEFKYKARPMKTIPEKMDFNKTKDNKLTTPSIGCQFNVSSHLSGHSDRSREKFDVHCSLDSPSDEMRTSKSKTLHMFASNQSDIHRFHMRNSELETPKHIYNSSDAVDDSIDGIRGLTSSIPKPVFTDLDDDFVYQPANKRTLPVTKIAKTADIMAMYQSYNSSNAMTGKEEKDMNGAPSPVPGDEFPYHLQSTVSHGLGEAARMHTETDVAEAADDSNVSSQRAKQKYRPLTIDMEEVLKEMRDLEEQNMSHESVPEILQPTCNLQPPGCVNSESYEAEKYLESEMLLQAEADYFAYLQAFPGKQNQKEHEMNIFQNNVDAIGENRDAAKYFISQQNIKEECPGSSELIKPSSAVFDPELEVLNIPKPVDVVNISNITVAMNTPNAINIAKLNAVMVTPKPEGIMDTAPEEKIAQFNCLMESDLKAEHYESSIKENITDEEMVRNKHISSDVEYLYCKEIDGSADKYGLPDNSIVTEATTGLRRQGSINRSLYPEIDVTNKTEQDGMEKNNNTSPKPEVGLQNNDSMALKTEWDEQNHVTNNCTENIQDPEISSGRSQAMQTVNYSYPKQFIETATSPIHAYLQNIDKRVEYCSTGTQCDLWTTQIPRLAHLAEGSLRVRKRPLVIQNWNKSNTSEEIHNERDRFTACDIASYIVKLEEEANLTKQRKLSGISE